MNDWMHKEYPKTVGEREFWKQIKRTVNGVPVSDNQIDMIVSAIKDGININPLDHVLDIGCANGALSQRFFPYCKFFLGIDFSEYLIQIAKKNFENRPGFIFSESDAISYLKSEEHPEKFTKCICYGVFSYLSEEDSESMLHLLFSKFINVESVFIGNLPDYNCICCFSTDYKYNLRDNKSPIGIWRSKKEFINISNKHGWNVSFYTMPKNFYASHYRYDVILKRH